MKKLLNLLDCLVVVTGILSFVFSFMYTGLMESVYLNLLVISALSCWGCLASAEHIRSKAESERLSKFIRKIKH